MALLKSGLITYEEALRQATNPDDFALRVSGITGTSDSKWDDFEQSAEAGQARPPAARATPARPSAPAASRPPGPRRPPAVPIGRVAGRPGRRRPGRRGRRRLPDRAVLGAEPAAAPGSRLTDSPQSRARARALRLLAARPRTEAQIRERLARAGFAEEADGVVAWLRDLRYLDDAAYARDRASVARRPGPARPAPGRAAARRGGDPAGTRPAGPSGRPWATTRRPGAGPRRAARPAGPSGASLDDREKARLSRFLLGRGFSGRAVSSALGVYVDDAEDR